jgi:tRNA threonylcarbamoyl adenosine modification protein YjeE
VTEAGPTTVTVSLPGEAATARLAEDIAAALLPGDILALSGNLGAGKSVLARAAIKALAGQPDLTVPSPTFALRVDYPLDRFAVTHVDLYRLTEDSEIDELGLDEALETGALIIEWPDRLRRSLSAERLDIVLEEENGGRVAMLTPYRSWSDRLARSRLTRAFLDGAGWHDARRNPIIGDASAKAFERVTQNDRTAILMNAPQRPESPPLNDALSYDAVAHRARNVRPFIAIDAELRRRGVHAPEIFAADIDAGLVLLEDLGGEGIVDAASRAILPRYNAAVDLLLAIHGQHWPPVAHAAGGVRHAVPAYDHDALLIEISLFADWFAGPAGTGGPAGKAGRPVWSAADREGFLAAWRTVLQDLDGGSKTAPQTWVLRDFHSPNILWIAGQAGLDRVGVIDFQDTLFGHAAYDVASLAQDARVDLSADQEAALKARYMAGRTAADPAFDAVAFEAAYAVFGAQRASKILGAFSRLASVGGKPGYLRQIDRAKDVLKRNLAHPVLSSLRLWYAPFL